MEGAFYYEKKIKSIIWNKIKAVTEYINGKDSWILGVDSENVQLENRLMCE